MQEIIYNTVRQFIVLIFNWVGGNFARTTDLI
jgi:hypothetical protein